MLRTRMTLLVAAAASALLIAGCGTTEEPAAVPSDAASTGPVTVTDSRGKTITLKSPATKVVGLEWGEVEMLVGLGVMPVGVADPGVRHLGDRRPARRERQGRRHPG
ncbi:hypothetical protein V2I01_43185 [Micromonospora sp. BRA006-A]|nr:hypothetical protein [Micromonospora sp. BRA006-A]